MNLKQLLMLKAAVPTAPRERTVVGNPVSFRTKYAEGMKLIIPFTPVQAGSGTPSPENVRPISGYSGVQIGVNATNFCPLPTAETKDGITLTHNADGSVTLTGTNGGKATYFDCISDFDSTLFAGYALSAGYDGTNATVRMRFTKDDYTAILNIGTASRAITDNGKHCKITIRVAANYAIPDGGVTFYPFLRKVSTDTFEPYTGTITPVSFSDTVYGGTLTVNDDQTGTLESEWGLISSYDGETLPGDWISDRDVYAVGTTPTTGAQVAYKLAESTTVDLTPDIVKSIIGLNNVWTDTNGENTVTYIK